MNTEELVNMFSGSEYAYKDHVDYDKRKLEMMLARMAMQWFGYKHETESECYVIRIPKDIVDQYKWISV